jgi:hypothetical protein
MAAAAEHQKYLIPSPNPGLVTQAMKRAGEMLVVTRRRLAHGAAGMIVSEDPRMRVPIHDACERFFKVEPGLRSIGQIQEIRENFEMIENAVKATTALCVSAQDPDSKEGGFPRDGFAYVGADGRPTIYLCPSFFAPKPSLGDGAADGRAGTIIHEIAHARLAIGHKGGEVLAFGGAAPSVRNFTEAIGNAYCYDAFVLFLNARH